MTQKDGKRVTVRDVRSGSGRETVSVPPSGAGAYGRTARVEPTVIECPRCGSAEAEIVIREDGAQAYACFPCRWRGTRGRLVRLSTWFVTERDGSWRPVS